MRAGFLLDLHPRATIEGRHQSTAAVDLGALQGTHVPDPLATTEEHLPGPAAVSLVEPQGAHVYLILWLSLKDTSQAPPGVALEKPQGAMYLILWQ